MHTEYWSENLKERALGRLSCRWKYNIKILKNYGGKFWSPFTASSKNQWWVAVNMVMNLWGFIKSREFLDQLSDCQLLQNS
jgi:hypothetical protein